MIADNVVVKAVDRKPVTPFLALWPVAYEMVSSDDPDHCADIVRVVDDAIYVVEVFLHHSLTFSSGEFSLSCKEQACLFPLVQPPKGRSH